MLYSAADVYCIDYILHYCPVITAHIILRRWRMITKILPTILRPQKRWKPTFLRRVILLIFGIWTPYKTTIWYFSQFKSEYTHFGSPDNLIKTLYKTSYKRKCFSWKNLKLRSKIYCAVCNLYILNFIKKLFNLLKLNKIKCKNYKFDVAPRIKFLAIITFYLQKIP